MNIHFIRKEFEKLAFLEDYINYEYEPKSNLGNLKHGKRNIYFDDIKLDFINEVNTYGFSPFILETFVQQRDNPNIMKFITKNLNYGLTNYIKVQTKGLISHSVKGKKNYKKILFSPKNKKKIKLKKENLISHLFLVKKPEDVKKTEEKANFLKKALGGVGGYKLNITMEDDKEKSNFNFDIKNQKLNKKLEEK